MMRKIKRTRTYKKLADIKKKCFCVGEISNFCENSAKFSMFKLKFGKKRDNFVKIR